MTYSKLNTLSGWMVFAIATAVYVLTIEPTASFWDCGEFIASAYKLQVGHPPGAPLFMMIARVFSLMASSPAEVAKWINICSALCSSFTILFLYWIITAFARKIVKPIEEETDWYKFILVFGSGAVGALAYTFSDSFWFSAVEGEVYAMSSFFTAIVMWAIMKWENVADEPHSDRWLILIAYLMGLSIGVHLLNLLCIPAITFVYYYKKFKPSRKGFLFATAISLFLLVFLQYGIIPGTVSLASKFELLFVNTFGLGLNSGLFFFLFFVVALLSVGLYFTQKNGHTLYNTALLGLTMIMIGYSSYALIVIRSNANPPLNENAPNNVFALLSYLNREQYGDRPLLYGQYYNTPLEIDYEEGEYKYESGNPVYTPILKDGKYRYEITDDRKGTVPVYDSKYCTVFPRMYSSQQSHISAYREWGNIKGKKVRTNRPDIEDPLIVPTFSENLRFFFTYQIGHMYLRYFMWNFAGRQNDVQGHGSILEGNWLSGIGFIDGLRLGPQENVSPNQKNSAARNTLFLLPLIIGLLGMYFHFSNKSSDAWVVMLLFLFTGLAIVVYLNQYPYQPRERDYAYAASFYAFCIWVGLGVMGLFDLLASKLNKGVSAALAFVATLFAAPVLMGVQEWDDHNRSNRYAARDFASNYLNSCAPNAILFTNGDNDTFPLWYAQEVEGIRTDIRVVNLSLLGTDWYIDQMKRKVYESDALPITMKNESYRSGTRDFVPIVAKDSGWSKLSDVMDFVLSDAPEAKTKFGGDRSLSYCPTRNILIPVDTQLVKSNGTVSELNGDSLVTEIQWKLKSNYLMKNDLAVLDILNNNNWKRPVYFAITVGSEGFMGLEDYFQLEGLTYRLVPIKAKTDDGMPGRVAADVMFENVMNKFKWGNIKDEKVSIDPETMRLATGIRMNINRLAEKLLEQGKNQKAIQLLDLVETEMPDRKIPYNFMMLGIAETYLKLKQNQKGEQILRRLFEIHDQDSRYFMSLKGGYYNNVQQELQQSVTVLARVMALTDEYKLDALSSELKSKFEQIEERFQLKM